MPVVIPLEYVNDETVILLRWLVANGAEVREGQPVAEVETSKAAIELLAPGNGYIAFSAQMGQEMPVGATIACISSQPESGAAAANSQLAEELPSARSAASSLSGVRFSKKALELIQRHGLSTELFASQAMVREADVAALLKEVSAIGANGAFPAAMRGILLDGVTLPAGCGAIGEGKLDSDFLSDVRKDREAFGRLSSAEKCAAYRSHGASIGADVELGEGAVILAQQLVLGDGVRIGDRSSVECSESFIAGRLSSFREGLSIQAATVVTGENVFGCRRVEISSGTANPWAILYVGDTVFIGDDVILDVSRPVVIGKEAFVAQRSIVITHNIGQSILEGYENRFEPVVLEDYCQVGMNSTLYAGSRVGKSSVLASNSYLLSAIPAGKLAVGVPARVLRGAARQPSHQQQVEIAKRMVQDFLELLSLRGYDVSPVAPASFILKHSGMTFRLVFIEAYPTDALEPASCDSCVIWTLKSLASPLPRHTIFDLLAKKIEGEGGIFAESAREFLRKRGIRCQPGPWRYRQGLI
jgi:acetyltransferase-like isoleucine patch superfamily enzyme